MKKTKNIRLILVGSLSAGTLASCTGAKAPISAETVYTNNFYVPGVGYYHAPFRTWYQKPYNYFEPQTRLYFFGGQWGAEPFESITNISSPPLQVATLAESRRTDVARGGFGYISGHYHGGFHGG